MNFFILSYYINQIIVHSTCFAYMTTTVSDISAVASPAIASPAIVSSDDTKQDAMMVCGVILPGVIFHTMTIKDDYFHPKGDRFSSESKSDERVVVNPNIDEWHDLDTDVREIPAGMMVMPEPQQALSSSERAATSGLFGSGFVSGLGSVLSFATNSITRIL